MKIIYQYIDFEAEKRKRFHPIEYIIIRYSPTLENNNIDNYADYITCNDFVRRYFFIADYIIKDNILIQTNDTDNYYCLGTNISAQSDYPVNNSNSVVIVTTKDTNIDSLIEYLKSKYDIKEVISDFNQLRQNYIEWRREQIGKI